VSLGDELSGIVESHKSGAGEGGDLRMRRGVGKPIAELEQGRPILLGRLLNRTTTAVPRGSFFRVAVGVEPVNAGTLRRGSQGLSLASVFAVGPGCELCELRGLPLQKERRACIGAKDQPNAKKLRASFEHLWPAES
jgi:hypothetical protein